MNADQRLLVVGLYLNAALYLLCCFAAGLWLNQPFVSSMALAAMGVSYLAYLAQLTPFPRAACGLLVFVSVFLGALSGFAFLLRIMVTS